MAESAKTPAVPKKRAPMLYFIIAVQVDQGRRCSLLLALGCLFAGGHGLSDLFDRLCIGCISIPKTGFFGDWRQAGRDHAGQCACGGHRARFFTACFSLVEGFGLIFRVPWAGWLAIGESAFFIPIEVRRTGCVIRPHWFLVRRADLQRAHRLVSVRQPEMAVPASPLNFPA